MPGEGEAEFQRQGAVIGDLVDHVRGQEQPIGGHAGPIQFHRDPLEFIEGKAATKEKSELRRQVGES